jgi:hypothetical protein
MPTSAQFLQLQARLEVLKGRFLSAPLDASGQYSEEAKDFARSYRVLAHAEIEAYVRARVDETVRHVLQQWRESRTPHPVLVSMLACWNKNWNDEEGDEVPFPNKEKKEGGKAITVDALVDRAFKAYQTNTERVYGIRPAHLVDFLLPLGIDINTDEFGPAWRAEIENFGIQRGRVAHGGEAGSQDISPDDERRRLDSILPGLEKLDAKFSELTACP